jgi:hypothetical protein
MHTVRRRDWPVQISQLPRLRFYLEGAEGPGPTGQRLETLADSLAEHDSSFNPEILGNSAPSLRHCLDPISVQKLIVDRGSRTRRDA